MQPRRRGERLLALAGQGHQQAAKGMAEAPERTNSEVFSRSIPSSARSRSPSVAMESPPKPTSSGLAQSGSWPLRVALSSTMLRALSPRVMELRAA